MRTEELSTLCHCHWLPHGRGSDFGAARRWRKRSGLGAAAGAGVEVINAAGRRGGEGSDPGLLLGGGASAAVAGWARPPRQVTCRGPWRGQGSGGSGSKASWLAAVRAARQGGDLTGQGVMRVVKAAALTCGVLWSRGLVVLTGPPAFRLSSCLVCAVLTGE